MLPRTLLAIPSYNCENQISRVLISLSKKEQLRSIITNVYVIINPSKDNTRSTAINTTESLGLRNWIHIVENVENYGLGGSQKIAFNFAIQNNYDRVVIFHGDDQGLVDDILKILDALDSGFEVANGARFMPRSNLDGYSKMRIFGNLILNVIYTLFSLRPVWDMGSGINGYKTSALKKISFEEFSDKFVFNMDLLLSLIKNRINYTYIPITWRETDQISNAKNLSVAFEALKVLLKWRFGLKTNCASHYLQRSFKEF